MVSITKQIGQLERKILEYLTDKKDVIFFILVTCLGILVRLSSLDFVSGDARFFLLPWFEEFRGKGVNALSEQIGDYNILYQFLIACMSYLPFNPLYLYKGLSIFFDFVLAIASGSLVYVFLNKKSQYVFVLTYAVILFIPTIILNSSAWAQCDSMYTSLIVLAILALFCKKYKMSFIFLGGAFALKLQAIFILPFLGYHYLKEKEFSIFHLGFSIFSFYLLCIPGFEYGRSLMDPIKIYFLQTGAYEYMWLNFPSFWILLGKDYESLRQIAIFVTIAVLGMGLLWTLNKKLTFHNGETFLSIAVWTVWSCILFLPAMHERYGFLLDVLLVLLTIVEKKYMPFAVVTVISSLMTYGHYLYGTDINLKMIALFYFVAYLGYSYYIIKRSNNIVAKENEEMDI